MMMPNQSAAANRRPAGQLDGSGNLLATVAADRAFPAAVAELGRSALSRVWIICALRLAAQSWFDSYDRLAGHHQIVSAKASALSVCTFEAIPRFSLSLAL